MATEKEPLPKIFCLFHQKTECSCINPVVTTKLLVERLEHHIRLNNLLNRHEPDAAKIDRRNQEMILFENRLIESGNASG